MSNHPFASLTPRGISAATARRLEDMPRNPWTGTMRSPRYFTLLQQRRHLPADSQRQRFLDLYAKHQVIIVEGQTGSGRTTQFPQFVLYSELPGPASSCTIVCTQPHRIATSSAAERVAEELDVDLGEQVGFSHGMQRRCGPSTVLNYTTDGSLVQELKKDGRLSRFRCIIIDEAHERTLSTDILLAHLKLAVAKNPDLRVIIMSATLDAAKFQAYYPGSPVLSIPGRTFEVELSYLEEPSVSFVNVATRAVVYIHENEPPGDILVFLPGEKEVDAVGVGVNHEFGPDVDVIPLYGALSTAQRQQAVQQGTSSSRRKCIVATNVAETSLTIEGIVYVVDSGLVRRKLYNPRCRLYSLLVSPASKAAARQRAALAGRTRPGQCYRLYTEHAFENVLIDVEYPEILRSALRELVITLKVLGVTDLRNFDFLDPPGAESMVQAITDLHLLGCIDGNANLTSLGTTVSKLPCDPMYGVALVHSATYGCSIQIAALNAFKSKQQELEDQEKQEQEKQDALQLWCDENYLSFSTLAKADQLYQDLLSRMAEIGIPINSVEDRDYMEYSGAVRRSLLEGFFLQLALAEKNSDSYLVLQTTAVQSIMAAPNSVLAKPTYDFVLYDNILLTGSCYMNYVSGIPAAWVWESAAASSYMKTLLDIAAQHPQKKEKYHVTYLRKSKADFNNQHAW